MNVPAYHIGVLKGYLSGQNAPAEIFVAAEALYMAAIQGPLRADALEAINLVAQAAEKLIASVAQEADVSGTVIAPIVPSISMSTAGIHEQNHVVLPEITRRALEMASNRGDEADSPTMDDDATKIEEFLKTKGATRCPSLGAVGSDREVIAGLEQPKKRKEWSPEARAAAGERMRIRQASKRSPNGQTGSDKRPPV